MQDKHNQYTDKELIHLFSSGKKEKSFNLILEKYQERLYWHIRKIVISHDDADDVLQNTFVKIWKGLEGFRAESQLFTWIYRIATNEAITHLNSRKKHNLLPLENEEYDLSSILKSDPWFNGDEAQIKLQSAILQLPEKQQLVFNLKYFEEMKYEDMSKILDTSVGALKASYHHAVKKIENYLNQD